MQTVEAGWQKFRGDKYPHFWAMMSLDGYGRSYIGPKKDGQKGFKPYPNSPYALLLPLMPGRKYAISWHHKEGGDWWLAINGSWVGRCPIKDFEGGAMTKESNLISFGGETACEDAGPLIFPAMGSGINPLETGKEFSQVASHKDIQWWWPTDNRTSEPLVRPAGKNYGVLINKNDPKPDQKSYYYGGPGGRE